MENIDPEVWKGIVLILKTYGDCPEVATKLTLPKGLLHPASKDVTVRSIFGKLTNLSTW